MADLYDLLTKRADELRGRPETWRDRLRDRFRVTDWQDIAFQALFWPHLVVLLSIEGWALQVLVRGIG